MTLDNAHNIFLQEADEENAVDAITGLRARTYFGRPNFDEIFQKMRKSHAGTGKLLRVVLVFGIFFSSFLFHFFPHPFFISSYQILACFFVVPKPSVEQFIRLVIGGRKLGTLPLRSIMARKTFNDG